MTRRVGQVPVRGRVGVDPLRGRAIGPEHQPVRLRRRGHGMLHTGQLLLQDDQSHQDNRAERPGEPLAGPPRDRHALQYRVRVRLAYHREECRAGAAAAVLGRDVEAHEDRAALGAGPLRTGLRHTDHCGTVVPGPAPHRGTGRLVLDAGGERRTRHAGSGLRALLRQWRQFQCPAGRQVTPGTGGARPHRPVHHRRGRCPDRPPARPHLPHLNGPLWSRLIRGRASRGCAPGRRARSRCRRGRSPPRTPLPPRPRGPAAAADRRGSRGTGGRRPGRVR